MFFQNLVTAGSCSSFHQVSRTDPVLYGITVGCTNERGIVDLHSIRFDDPQLVRILADIFPEYTIMINGVNAHHARGVDDGTIAHQHAT